MYVVVFLALCTGSVFSDSILAKCRASDSKCLNESFQAALPKVFAGIPERGVESSDPLYLEVIESIQPTLTANYTKVTVKGYKDCKIENVKFNLEKSLLNYDLICAFDIFGDYTVTGRLLVIPIEGDGKFTLNPKKILLRIEAETQQVDGKDGKKHLNFKNFKLQVEALEKFDFHLENLFNGNKQLADGVNNIIKANYKEVAREITPPFFQGTQKKIFKNINKFFKTVPIEDILTFE